MPAAGSAMTFSWPTHGSLVPTSSFSTEIETATLSFSFASVALTDLFQPQWHRSAVG
jgi:hypothetical protein